MLTNQLESEVGQRTRERDRIWKVSEDLLGVANFDGYFLSVNPAWTDLLGWTEDEIKSLHVGELRHPDDCRRRSARADLAQGVPTVRMENRFRHRDGSWRWIAWTMTAEDGQIYVIGSSHHRREKGGRGAAASEQQFRALVAGVTDYALIMLDPTAHIELERRRRTDQRLPAEEIVGRHFSLFYTPEDRKAGLRTVRCDAAAAGYSRPKPGACEGRLTVLGQRRHRRHPRRSQAN